MLISTLLTTVGAAIDVTSGNVIQLLGTVIAIGMLWQKLKDKIEEVAKRVEHHDVEILKVNENGGIATSIKHKQDEATLCDHDERLKKVETAITKIDVLSNDVLWIKRKMGGTDNE